MSYIEGRICVRGGGCAASVASLTLGIFFLDREPRTAEE